VIITLAHPLVTSPSILIRILTDLFKNKIMVTFEFMLKAVLKCIEYVCGIQLQNPGLITLAHYIAKRYVTLHGFPKDTLRMVQAQDRDY
jgi:hypothetical protein